LDEFAAPDRSRGWRLGVLAILILAAAAVLYVLGRQQVQILVDGQRFQLSTHQQTVAGVLEKAGIVVGAGDLVSPQPAEGVEDGLQIVVDRAKLVSVDVDGRMVTRRTQAESVAALFDEMDIVLGPEDRVVADGVVIWPSAGGALPGDGPLPVLLQVRRSSEMEVIEGETRTSVHTTEATVGKALQGAGYVLYLGDDVQPPLHTAVEPGIVVTISRSLPAAVEVDGKIIHTRTHQNTVAEFLAELGVALIGQDYAIPDLDQPMAAGLEVRIVRVLEEMITEQESIPYATTWQPDPELEIDHQRLVQEGVPGVLQRRIRVRYENGQEVSRILEDEWTAVQPAAHILAYGTTIVVRQMETPDGAIEYWRTLRVLATSYSASTAGVPREDPHYGLTATGMPMAKGIVAVDPRVVNLHQRMYVPGYGVGLAADTGGAIKGRRIDLGYDDQNLVLWYKWVDIYLLTPAPDPGAIRYQIGG